MTRQAAPAASRARDPLDEPLAELAGRYGPRRPRHSVEAVAELAERAHLARVPRHIAVVGSNGKTSTATYVARLLQPDARVGLYTSPHILRWTERLVVDGREVEPGDLLGTLRALDATAAEIDSEELRFFDLLTLAAEQLFARRGVEVGVFEAGIGGRLDAVRTLEPELCVVTSIALEHQELLGPTREDILREKLGVAPPGATVISAPLEDPLREVARSVAAERGFELRLVAPARGSRGSPDYLAANMELAKAAVDAARSLFAMARSGHAQVDTRVRGRFDAGSVAGVPYCADVAHNPRAWESFLEAVAWTEAEPRAVAVVSITRERPVAELARTIAESGAIDEVVVTRASVRETHEPAGVAGELRARGVPAEPVGAPPDAFERAFAHARSRGARVLVFGSTYLVSDFLEWTSSPRRA